MLSQNLKSGTKIIRINFKTNPPAHKKYEILTFDYYYFIGHEYFCVKEYPLTLYKKADFLTLKEFRLMKLKELL